jgi:hypothetical protein
VRKPRCQRLLSRQLISYAFLVLCMGLMVKPSILSAQQPQSAWQPNAYSGAPAAYGAIGKMHHGVPTSYDPARLAEYYGVDPSLVNGATLPYDQQPEQKGYGIDLAAFGRNSAPEPSNGGPQQEYLMDPNANPYRQASMFGGPGDGRGGTAPQAVPNIAYNAAPGLSVYGTPDPNRGSGGMRFTPKTPPWLTGFEAGAYANDDELLLTLGGTLKIWEGTHSAIGTRVLGSVATFHNGPGKVGVSVDVWGATRLELLGVGHLLKVGGLWDQQGDLHRGGFTVAGILFPEMAKTPLTFDLAFGFGGGSGQWQGMYREVADYDAQIRAGIILFDILRVGGSIQYWQWNNPIFDPNQSSAGGYAQIDFGQWMLTGDVQATKENAQGFLNVVWLPGRRHGPLHSPKTVNVTSTRAMTKYRSWMTAAPIRDLAMRTGEAPATGRGPTPVSGVRVGNITNVLCTSVLTTDPDDPLNPDQTAGIVDPSDVVTTTITFVNNTPQDSSVPPTATTGTLYQTLAVVGNGTTTVAMSTPVSVPAGTAIPAPTLVPITIDALAAVGDSIFLEFEVLADGQIGRFRCGPITVGAAPPATMSATFLGYVIPPTP